ncbi:MAG: hypothetical protein ACYC3L_01340 [Gemmatimonadaceae bacterium]
MSRFRYSAARARRILSGGAVTVPQVNARSWGRDALTEMIVSRPAGAPDLLPRLRLARQNGWTLAALYERLIPAAPYGSP